jgi:hypothetical protein
VDIELVDPTANLTPQLMGDCREFIQPMPNAPDKYKLCSLLIGCAVLRRVRREFIGIEYQKLSTERSVSRLRATEAQRANRQVLIARG